MKRREVHHAVRRCCGGVAVAARAQQPAKLPTVGFIGSDSPDPYADRLRAFRLGLKSTGFTEGQNVTIDIAGPGPNDRLPELTADPSYCQVAVIVAPTTPSVLAAKAATRQFQSSFLQRVTRSTSDLSRA